MAVQRYVGQAGRTIYATRLSNPNLANGVVTATTRVYIRGAAELSRALARLGKEMSDEAMAQATLAGAEVLKEAWAAAVPVDDGNYRDSITAMASPGREGATAVVFPGTVAGVEERDQPRNYAARLEYGSFAYSKAAFKRGSQGAGRRRSAQPSLRPAYDASTGRMVAAMESELRWIIERAT